MTASAQMPRYQCHKKVWALKIKEVQSATDEDSVTGGGHWPITPEDTHYAQFAVTNDFMLRHNPQAGGYFVVYEGGYKSYSPAKEFESGYTLID